MPEYKEAVRYVNLLLLHVVKQQFPDIQINFLSLLPFTDTHIHIKKSEDDLSIGILRREIRDLR